MLAGRAPLKGMPMQTRLHRRIALALLIGLASALHVIEGLLPPIPVPGARLGLANLGTVVALRLLGFRAGVTVSFARSLLGGLLGGTLLGPGFLMGLAGAVASALAMGLAAPAGLGGTGNLGLSVVGAVTHSVAQVAVASALTRTAGVWLYLPLLLGLSIVTGLAVGAAADGALPLIAGHWGRAGEREGES